VTRKVIYIGYEPREEDALGVCVNSIKAHLSEAIDIRLVVLSQLVNCGLYRRPTSVRMGQVFDDISDAPMSTQFAISRFFIPKLCDADAALFMDCDMLVRCDLTELFAKLDTEKAIQVVQHEHKPTEQRKMDGQVQTAYSRKNWSSVMLWNLKHPAHRNLTVQHLNTLRGRDLHNFCWLNDSEIGALDRGYNHLVGVNEPNPDARIVHFTLGIPSMAGYENCEFAEEWRNEHLYAP